MEAEDRDLGVVDERRDEQPAELAGARDGERRVPELLGRERARTCALGETGRLARDLLDGQALAGRGRPARRGRRRSAPRCRRRRGRRGRCRRPRAARSARGARRARRAEAWIASGTSSETSTSVKSHSSTNVTAGISRCARETCSTIARRIPRIGTRRPSPDPAADARTSDSWIRPPGPVGWTPTRSTPSSLASCRTAGVARTASTGSGGTTATSGSAGAASRVSRRSTARSSCSPSSPITTSTAPTGAISPSSTRILSTVPARGDGISTVVLSVCTSTSGSSSSMLCPSATSHRAISASVRPSPRSGSLNS